MNTIQQVEQVLTERGFKLINNLKDPSGFVYGKIVQANVCFRFYSYCNDKGSKNPAQPFLLKFVTKKGNQIVKIGSERRVHTLHFATKIWQQNLIEAVEQWEMLLGQEDTICNKCGGSGVYCWFSKSNNACSGECNRCGGKGYQDYNDRKKNFHYDRYAERLTAQGADCEGEVYADWIPHWIPDVENLENPNFHEKAKNKNKVSNS